MKDRIEPDPIWGTPTLREQKLAQVVTDEEMAFVQNSGDPEIVRRLTEYRLRYVMLLCEVRARRDTVDRVDS